MILYYTRSQKTKVFAEALHDILGLPMYKLESDLDNMKNFKFLFKALSSVFMRKEISVGNMPTFVPSEVYLCGPIWGGCIAGPCSYFLKHMDLSNTKVNLLITAQTPVEKYRVRALEDLARINCIQGDAYIFATTKDLPEKDVIIEQLCTMLPGGINK